MTQQLMRKRLRFLSSDIDETSSLSFLLHASGRAERLATYFDRRRIALVPVLVLAIAVFSGCARTVSSSYSPPGELSLKAAADPGKSPSARTLYALSRVMDREDQGEAILLRLIREYPAFMPAYCDLAKLRVDQGRLDDAIETLEKGLEADSRDPVLRNNLGVCYLLKADYDQAFQEFSAAFDIAPLETRYKANMALATGMMGQSVEAHTLYSQVLRPEQALHNMDVIAQISGVPWQPVSQSEPAASAEPEPALEQPIDAASIERPATTPELPFEAAAPPLEPASELVALEPPASETESWPNQPEPVLAVVDEPAEAPEPVVAAVEEPTETVESLVAAEETEPEVIAVAEPEPVVADEKEPVALAATLAEPAESTVDETPSKNEQADSDEQLETDTFEPIPLTPFRAAYSKQNAS